jgi:uncharacterized membrane protein
MILIGFLKCLRRPQSYAAFIFLACILLPFRAQAQFAVCNRTTVPLEAAIAYVENGEWYVKGWFQIGPSACATVTAEITSPYYYVHAHEIGGKRKWGKDVSFCVNPTQRFEIPITRPCGQGEEAQSFYKVDVGNRRNYKYGLTCHDCPPDFATFWARANTPPPSSAPPAPPPAGPPAGFQPVPEGPPAGFQPVPDGPPEGFQSVPEEQPDWQKHLDWSRNNSDAGGSVDCPLDYPYPECILRGGRACLMAHAEQSARDNDCANAFRVALITQCQNPEATQLIAAAGESEVCQYLGPPDPPKPQPSPPPPAHSAPTSSARPVTFVNQSGMTLYIYYFLAGGTVDCRNYTYGGVLADQNRSFTIPAGRTAHFVFQKEQAPCPVSTIRSEWNTTGGQTVTVQ